MGGPLHVDRRIGSVGSVFSNEPKRGCRDAQGMLPGLKSLLVSIIPPIDSNLSIQRMRVPINSTRLEAPKHKVAAVLVSVKP